MVDAEVVVADAIPAAEPGAELANLRRLSGYHLLAHRQHFIVIRELETIGGPADGNGMMLNQHAHELDFKLRTVQSRQLLQLPLIVAIHVRLVTDIVPLPQPALQLGDLGTLCGDDVLAHLFKLRINGFVRADAGHGNSHRVVINHVFHEVDLERGLRPVWSALRSLGNSWEQERGADQGGGYDAPRPCVRGLS